jgi:hypothetical protein
MMGFRHHALALAAVASLLPQAASAEEPVEAAIREWVAAIDAAPGWSAGFRGLAYDPASDAATLSGLAVQTDVTGVSIGIETIVVTGFVERADGGFSARSVTADGIAAKAGFANVAIADLELDGLTAPAMQPFAYDPEKPFTTMMRGYAEILKASLESGRIGSLQIIEQFEDVTSRVSYEHIKIDGFAEGKIASIRSGPLRMEAPSPQGLVKVTIGGMESRNFDLAGFVRVYNPDAYAGGTGDMVWRTVLGLAAYTGIEVEVPGAKIAFGEIALEDFRMRQPRKSFAEFFDAVMADPDMGDEQAAKLAKAHVPNMLSAFGIGRFGIDRFEVAAQGIDHFRLDSFRIDDFSADGLGELTMAGLNLAVPDQGSVRLGRFAFGGITFPSIDAIQQAIDTAESGVEVDPKTLAARLGFVELAGIDIRAAGKDPVVLGKFRLDLDDYVGFVPTRIAAELAGLIIPTSVIDDPEGRKIFERLGYDTLDASYGLDVHWDEASETLAVDNISVAVKGVGSFVAKLALAGLTRAAIENPERIGDILPGLSLATGTFTFTDGSIVGKSLDILAETMKAPPDKFRQQFADAMPFLLSISALNDPKFLAIVQKSGLMKQLQPAVKEFVGTPGSSITVTVAPTTPVPLSEITRITNDAPDTLVSVLGLSVSGEAGAAPAPAPSAEPAPAAAPSNDDEGDPMRKTIAPP